MILQHTFMMWYESITLKQFLVTEKIGVLGVKGSILYIFCINV
jgi:hypothetical protein